MCVSGCVCFFRIVSFYFYIFFLLFQPQAGVCVCVYESTCEGVGKIVCFLFESTVQNV